MCIERHEKYTQYHAMLCNAGNICYQYRSLEERPFAMSIENEAIYGIEQAGRQAGMCVLISGIIFDSSR